MKKFLKSPWTISLSTALFSFLLTIAYDLLKGKELLSTIKTIFHVVLNGISAFFNFQLKVWWILLGLGIIVIAIILIIYITDNILPQKPTLDKPKFTQYTEDYFGSWRWTWEWRFSSSSGMWNIQYLVAYCPKCDTQMILDYREEEYSCPRCGFSSLLQNGHKKRYEVEALILDNVRRREEASKNET